MTTHYLSINSTAVERIKADWEKIIKQPSEKVWNCALQTDIQVSI